MMTRILSLLAAILAVACLSFTPGSTDSQLVATPPCACTDFGGAWVNGLNPCGVVYTCNAITVSDNVSCTMGASACTIGGSISVACDACYGVLCITEDVGVTSPGCAQPSCVWNTTATTTCGVAYSPSTTICCDATCTYTISAHLLPSGNNCSNLSSALCRWDHQYKCNK